MKIAILDDYTDSVRKLEAFKKLADLDVTVWTDHCQDTEALAARLADVEVLALLRERTTIGAELLERLPNLKLISMRGAYPHIDLPAATRAGVVLSSKMGGGGGGSTTAELTWGLVIAALRQIPQQVASMKAGSWQVAPGASMHGKTVGVFGYGRIGKDIARYAQAFGMKVLVWGREGSLSRAAADGWEIAPDQATFFETCDVLSLHLRLSDSTQAIVGAQDLARM